MSITFSSVVVAGCRPGATTSEEIVIKAEQPGAPECPALIGARF
jgi:hypothetical protein